MKMMEGYAYFPLGKLTFLCIGTEAEVTQASHDEIRNCIVSALALAEYNAIQSAKRLTAH